jgi:hypothetical protein
MNRPWAEYYPANKNTPNRYALFSPVFDRFILVDNLTPWTVFKAGQILSSKIINVTYILKADQLTNENCLNFGTLHKRNELMYGASSMSSIKQSASMAFLKNNEILEKGWPEEYVTESRRLVIQNLQEYALFVLQCLHAITIAECYRNLWPEAKYLENFFHGTSPNDFKIKFDPTTAPRGMMYEIENILYHSLTLTEAKEKIDQAWITYSQKDNAGFRNLFYSASGLPQPNFDYSIVADNYTFWAC